MRKSFRDCDWMKKFSYGFFMRSILFENLSKYRINDPSYIGKIYKHCFCYLNVQNVETKEFFVSRANSALVGILITIDDVTDIFAVQFYLHRVYYELTT